MTSVTREKLDVYLRERLKGCKSVYMPYITLGDPDFGHSVEFAIGMIDAGADLLELGIPFSDPTADGPVIQEAMVRAMRQADFSMSRVLEATRAINEARPDVPLILLSYFNPIVNGLRPAGSKPGYRAEEGLIAFLDQARSAGVRGLVIPDLPFDAPESELLRNLVGQYDMQQILMAAPNTGDDRLRSIAAAASGFIYYVTSLGVTGLRSSLPADLGARIDRVRQLSGLPVMAGFGFSEPSQAAALAGAMDGIIVGSLNQRTIAEQGAAAGPALARLTAAFAAASHRGRT